MIDKNEYSGLSKYTITSSITEYNNTIMFNY